MSTNTMERVNVTTVEEMDALPNGTHVLIAGVAPGWTKRNDLWCCGPATHGIPAVHFRSYLDRQEVVVTPNDGSVEVGPGVTITPVTTPEPTPLNDDSHNTGLIAFRHEVESALHEYLSDNNGLTSTERENLQEVLENLGLDRHTNLVEVNVEVEVTGTYSTYMDSAMAAEVGGDVEVDMNQINIEWAKMLTYSIDEHPEGQCACEEVTSDWVSDMLSSEGVSYDDFEFHPSCPND